MLIHFLDIGEVWATILHEVLAGLVQAKYEEE